MASIDMTRFALTTRYAAVGRALAIPSTSAEALAVGPAGSAFDVDASATHAATGLVVRGTAPGGSPSLTATSTAANEDLAIVPKGSGTVTVNGDLGVSGLVYGTAATPPASSFVFPSASAPITTAFVANAATSGGTYAVASGGTYTLPSGTAALGCTWRFVLTASLTAAAIFQPSPSTTIVGQAINNGTNGDTVVPYNSATASPLSFNSIGFNTSAAIGDWIEFFGVTSGVLGFRAETATPSAYDASTGHFTEFNVSGIACVVNT